ncbi:MAG: anti-sigma factor antagonist [Spartobacteria bacterium]|nr:anti-sigma factor antagonist [Spartobacteria bacterium]
MDMHSEIQDRTIIMRLKGRLDTVGAAAAQACFDKYHTEDYASVVFDLTHVEFIASAGIRVLLIAAKEAESRGGKLALAGVGGYCLDVLSMSGMVHMLPRYASLDEALAACRQ